MSGWNAYPEHDDRRGRAAARCVDCGAGIVDRAGRKLRCTPCAYDEMMRKQRARAAAKRRAAKGGTT